MPKEDTAAKHLPLHTSLQAFRLRRIPRHRPANTRANTAAHLRMAHRNISNPNNMVLRHSLRHPANTAQRIPVRPLVIPTYHPTALIRKPNLQGMDTARLPRDNTTVGTIQRNQDPLLVLY